VQAAERTPAKLRAPVHVFTRTLASCYERLCKPLRGLRQAWRVSSKFVARKAAGLRECRRMRASSVRRYAIGAVKLARAPVKAFTRTLASCHECLCRSPQGRLEASISCLQACIWCCARIYKCAQVCFPCSSARIKCREVCASGCAGPSEDSCKLSRVPVHVITKGAAVCGKTAQVDKRTMRVVTRTAASFRRAPVQTQAEMDEMTTMFHTHVPDRGPLVSGQDVRLN